MATSLRPKEVKVAYRFQRVYADLQTGHALTVKATRAEPVRPFMQQSDLDGACGVHLAAMIVSIYGLAKPSALHEMGRRKFGLAAEIFSAFKHTYFTGVHAAEWVELFNGLHLPLQLTSKFGVEDNADGHAVEWLMRGEMVALAFASIKHQKTKHWSLGIAIEGAVIDKIHRPDTILLLDPSASEPGFQAFNARMRLPVSGAGGRSAKSNLVKPSDAGKRKPVTWLYESMEWNAEEVRLLAAVRIRRTDTS